MRVFSLLAGLAGVAILAGLCVFTVDRAEYVYVTQFGRPVATYDGATQAGLRFRWPWPVQSVQHLDRRLEVLDLPPTEQLTRDAGGQTIDRTLTVEGYVCWRIADAEGVDRFIRTVGTMDRARALLSQQISSQLSAEIGKMEITQFLSDQPGQVDQGMTTLRQHLLGQLQNPSAADAPSLQGTRDDYGIEIVDIRLRRYNYPVEVRPAIAQRIISEREKKKAEYESEATVKVGKIMEDNEREVRRLRAEADAQEKQIKGEADAEADRIRNQAFSQDTEFYVFLKKLQEYESILGNNRTVLLLSSHRELFDLLFAPPKPAPGAGSTNTVTASRPRPAASTPGGQ